MFQVMIAQLQNSADRMERQIRQLSYAEDSLVGVITAMSSMSGMGDIVPQLRRNLADIRQESEILWQMLQVLDKTLQNYISYENRIVSEFEQNSYSFMPRDMGRFDIPGVSGLIR